ncbi:MAG: photosynthetic reaction center cytochrome c subunit family protein [Acidobacteria bacterium]|nr:photosynthetic reaction center cytochrome c subunit family protein [Acidobacteriota bacterium]
MGTSQRTLFGSAVAALVAILFGMASLVAQAPVPGPQPSGEFFKNVTVLTTMPAHLMQPTMQQMEIALGVHCVYCHEGNNTQRDLETPLKETAREMMRMVADINRTQFEGREVVTCNTCHQGRTKPTSALPYNGEEGTTGPLEATGPVPTVDELLTRYTAALGGAEAIANLPGRHLTGTVTNYGHIDQVHPQRAPTQVLGYEILAKGPDTLMTIQHNINNDAVTVMNGDGGWTRGNGAPTDLRPDLLAVAKLENAVMHPSQLTGLLSNLTVVGQEMVGERSTWVVSGTSEWLPEVTLYFDQATAYLLSLSYQQKSGYCCHVFRNDYDNFLATNGVRMPMRWTMNGPREQVTVYEFDSAEIGPIDDARFARPTP